MFKKYFRRIILAVESWSKVMWTQFMEKRVILQRKKILKEGKKEK